MADIVSNGQKIQAEETDFQSPQSESLFQRIGGSINELLDRTNASKIERFVASGTTTSKGQTGFTFVVPDDATILYFWLIGGGGGGGGTDNNLVSGNYLGGAGGCGAYPSFGFVPVIGGSTLTVNVGQGGAGGNGNENGSDGGDTQVTGGSVNVIARGNGGGERALDGGNNSFNRYQIGTSGGNGSTNPTAGFGSQAYAGGSPGSDQGGPGFVIRGGGGGGSSILARGGNGGNANTNGANATGIGAGGGGAGGSVGPFRDGGNGGVGAAVLVTYRL